MKHRFGKFLLGLAVSAMLFAGIKSPAQVRAAEGDIVILYTNDTHAYIDKTNGFQTIAAMKADYEAQGRSVLTVDAGDHIQGTAYGSFDRGEHVISMMEAAGYDLLTFGNHEFDYGMQKTLQYANESKLQYVSCNFYDKRTGKSVADAYRIFDLNGTRIGIVGITTPETFTASTPKYFMDDKGNTIYGITGVGDSTGETLYASVQAAIDAAKAEGADYVLCLGHLGLEEYLAPWRSVDVIKNVSGLTAFIDGHSHTVAERMEVPDKDGKTVILTQTGSYFDAIGEMTLSPGGKVTTRLVKDYPGSKASVNELVTGWSTVVNNKLNEVIAHTDIDLLIKDPVTGKRLIRSRETNLGNLCADALYFIANAQEDVWADVAFLNGGGIRESILTGDISYKTCKNLEPFGNELCIMSMTGQNILDALEWGAKGVTRDRYAESGGFLHTAGITYTIDPDVKPNIVTDEKFGLIWAGAAGGDYRVKNVKVLNRETHEYEPLDLNKRYNVAGITYILRNMGEGYNMFADAVDVRGSVGEYYLLLAEYIKTFPVDKTTGLPTITADSAYVNPYGRGSLEIAGESRPEASPVTAEAGKITAVIDAAGADTAAADTYTVQSGDSLSRIAGKLFGSEPLWKKIYEANRNILADPNLIYPGQKLVLSGVTAG